MARLSVFKKYPALSTLLILEFVLLIIVSYQIQVDGRVSLLERTMMTIFAPVQELSNNVLGGITESFEDKKKRLELERENGRLKRALADYRQVVTQLAETELENERLRQLLELPREDGWTYVHAEVTASNHRRNDYMITINKGYRHGIRRDYGVVCDDGVVGVVWEVSRNHAKVMTANNPSAVIAAMLQDDRDAESFVAGFEGRQGKLQNFPNFKTLAPQQMVLTSGLDGVFPKGLHIGHVTAGKTSSYMFQDVKIVFSTEFTRLEEVTVLVPLCEEDADAVE
ncbi:MAG: rod shape-determining protein MreC [Acidobacteriota bacterium]|nr:rod shape-determining protein MreC [Acidobacteriota bacterium]